jgi:hypothetical protein
MLLVAMVLLLGYRGRHRAPTGIRMVSAPAAASAPQAAG